MRASLELERGRKRRGCAQTARGCIARSTACRNRSIGRVHGAALGGGAGLAAVCDIVVAAEGTIFGFTETKLGILPAVISPFVIAKIGRSHARALFLTGERFDAGRAFDIGLVHEVAAVDALDAAVDRVVAEVLSASPTGIAAAKRLIAAVAAAPYEETLEYDGAHRSRASA